MKILVSGASGFIGSHILKHRTEIGDEVFALSRPSTSTTSIPESNKIFCFDGNTANLDDFLKQEKFDGVIHLATNYLAAHKTEDIRGLVDSNILLGTILLDLASKNEVSWFINACTFTQHYNDEDYFPTNLYSATKQAFQDIAKFYAITTQMTVTNLSLFDTFGENDTRKKIMNILLDAVLNDEELAMSPGNQIIDISHIDNVVYGFDVLINSLNKSGRIDYNNKTFTLPSNERLPLKDLVKLFSAVYGKSIKVCFGKKEYRPFEVMIPWTTGIPLPGWEPKISLKDGILDFIKSHKR